MLKTKEMMQSNFTFFESIETNPNFIKLKLRFDNR